MLACRHPPPECAEPRNLGWVPSLEWEVRADESTATWTAGDGASIDASAEEGCVEAPCLSVTGEGYAATTAVLNREVRHRLTGTLSSTAVARVSVVQLTETGLGVELAGVAVPPGDSELELAFTIEETGSETQVLLEVTEGAAILDDFTLEAETWAAVDTEPAALLDLGFLVHLERDQKLWSDEAHWRRRARVVEGLTSALVAHGARLGVQPDSTFVRGATVWEPGWVGDRQLEEASWSIHLHAEEDEGDAVSAVESAKLAFESAGVSPADLNGGFVGGEWARIADLGVGSLTAYKDPATQSPLALAYAQPWRPPDGSGEGEAERFATHDPGGPLLYLPGSPIKETDHARFPAFAERVLSQALANARAGFVNTWYFVLHVDRFGPEDLDALDAYLADGSLEEDLAAYDRMLTEVADPLVEAGVLRYASPDEMRERALAWESVCAD